MEDKVKQIIAGFINVSPAEVTTDTIIDRSAVSSSIILHRMYAKLAGQGIAVENYHDIKTVGMLLQRIHRNGSATQAITALPVNGQLISEAAAASPGIGIDIEDVAALPRTNDFREAPFYQQNFSATEIAYCILQPDPYASFAGLFAAKEAIVKADNQYRSMTFNTIEIEHSPEGKPAYRQFQLSISHANNLAVAVAVQSPAIKAPASEKVLMNEKAQKQGSPVLVLLVILCVLLSATALYFALEG